jgi:hypothetical protein
MFSEPEKALNTNLAQLERRSTCTHATHVRVRTHVVHVSHVFFRVQQQTRGRTYISIAICILAVLLHILQLLVQRSIDCPALLPSRCLLPCKWPPTASVEVAARLEQRQLCYGSNLRGEKD